VSCSAGAALRTVTLIHEIGHLFGAIHVTDRSSIMYPVAEFDARFFDSWNRQVLALTRERRFGRPLGAALRAQLEQIYQSAADADRVPRGDLRTARAALD